MRNWIAQSAIDRAEKGDFSEVQRVMALLRSPYSDAPLEELLAAGPEELLAAGLAEAGRPGVEQNAAAPSGISCAIAGYDAKPPAWAEKLCVT